MINFREVGPPKTVLIYLFLFNYELSYLHCFPNLNLFQIFQLILLIITHTHIQPILSNISQLFFIYSIHNNAEWNHCSIQNTEEIFIHEESVSE